MGLFKYLKKHKEEFEKGKPEGGREKQGPTYQVPKPKPKPKDKKKKKNGDKALYRRSHSGRYG